MNKTENLLKIKLADGSIKNCSYFGSGHQFLLTMVSAGYF